MLIALLNEYKKFNLVNVFMMLIEIFDLLKPSWTQEPHMAKI